MKILFAVTQGEQGGAQKYTLDLVSSFQKLGHQVGVCVGQIENQGDRWLFSELEKCGVHKENLFVINSHQREIKLFQDFKSIKEFVNCFAKVEPDIIHLNSSKAGVVGAISGFIYKWLYWKNTKIFFTVHGFVFLEPMNFLKKVFFIFLEFVSARLRDHTILISEKDIRAGKKYKILLGKLGEKYSLIFNGIADLKDKMLDRNLARRFLFQKIGVVDSGQQIVGTIANLYKTKGLEYMIETAGRIFAKQKSSTPLFFVLGFGDRDYTIQLQNKINSYNLQNNFFLLGRTPEAFRYLKGMDIFLLTSVKEGLPYTLLESAMAGLPIVATSVGGIPEIARNIKMTLVESKNIEQIRNAVVENLKEENLEKNRSNFDKIYSLETMVEKTLEVYKSMIH
jgi:glycosyltransferase involved in cell wall biosynthesis